MEEFKHNLCLQFEQSTLNIKAGLDLDSNESH